MYGWIFVFPWELFYRSIVYIIDILVGFGLIFATAVALFALSLKRCADYVHTYANYAGPPRAAKIDAKSVPERLEASETVSTKW